MIVHRAAWVLPIVAPPIRNGWVSVDRGVITAVGTSADSPPETVAQAFRPASPFASLAILPGLVNAHTHLELSWMRGRVPPGDRFDDWIRAVVGLRRQNPDTSSPAFAAAALAALEEARACGTVLFGDISNTLLTVPLFRQAGASAHVFHELIGFNEPDPEHRVRLAREKLNALVGFDRDVRVSLAPHAPYTVSPALFGAIRRDLDSHAGGLCSVHLGESREEVEFLRHGSGPIARALRELGAWNAGWTPPACGPAEYLERVGLMDDRVIVVHGVQLADAELERLAAAGATLVTCPRSNIRTGAGAPPIGRFYTSGVRVAIGTDSLASVDDLDLFAELAAVRTAAPGVAASKLLASATRHGADALGFGAELGTIEPGKRAELIAVRIPDGITDVEEYLVGGVQPADIRWLSTTGDTTSDLPPDQGLRTND